TRVPTGGGCCARRTRLLVDRPCFMWRGRRIPARRPMVERAARSIACVARRTVLCPISGARAGLPVRDTRPCEHGARPSRRYWGHDVVDPVGAPVSLCGAAIAARHPVPGRSPARVRRARALLGTLPAH